MKTINLNGKVEYPNCKSFTMSGEPSNNNVVRVCDLSDEAKDVLASFFPKTFRRYSRRQRVYLGPEIPNEQWNAWFKNFIQVLYKDYKLAIIDIYQFHHTDTTSEQRFLILPINKTY